MAFCVFVVFLDCEGRMLVSEGDGVGRLGG